MSVEETERTIRGYLDALLGGGDFASFFAEDVSWTTMENGDQISGRAAVADFIVALHRQLFDAKPELVSVTTADGTAAIEAVFAGTQIAEVADVPATGAVVRIPYSVAYDISDGQISALRAYFPIQGLVETLREAAAHQP
jgi:steroid delta-isomerase-like uncharacterized protein